MQAGTSNAADPGASKRSRWDAWYFRVPVKLAIFMAVTLFVLFPYPLLLRQHLQHVLNMQAMVQPDAPELAAWDDELRAVRETRLSKLHELLPQAPTSQETRAVQRGVEKFVYDHVKYEWDWNIWGMADYMPTVGEMFEQARNNGGQMLEDCDGRAVMAASILRRMGYDAQLATDLRHVWVVTPEQELMGPGGEKTAVTTSQGTKVNVVTAATNIPISLSFGIAVFPFWRELVIAMTAVLLMAFRRASAKATAISGILVIQGLLFMRLGWLSPRTVSPDVSSWPAWVGMAHIAAGLVLLLCAGRQRKQIIAHAAA